MPNDIISQYQSVVNAPNFHADPSAQQTAAAIRARVAPDYHDLVTSPGFSSDPNAMSYGEDGCARFVCSHLEGSGLPFEKTASAKGLEDGLLKNGWTRIPQSQAIPGDIIGTHGTGPSRRHVGIYAGNGQMYADPGSSQQISRRPPVNAGPAQVAPRAGGSNADFYNNIYNLAVKHGDPHPDIVAAQAIVETGYGKHAPDNNYFGMKGPGYTRMSNEYENGKMSPKPSSFRGYPSLDASVADRVGKVTSGSYAKNGYLQPGTEAGIRALVRTGYATDPNYASMSRSIIGKYGRPSGKP